MGAIAFFHSVDGSIVPHNVRFVNIENDFLMRKNYTTFTTFGLATFTTFATFAISRIFSGFRRPTQSKKDQKIEKVLKDLTSTDPCVSHRQGVNFPENGNGRGSLSPPVLHGKGAPHGPGYTYVKPWDEL